MNEKIAKALVEDMLRSGRDTGSIRFHDGAKVYIVEVTSTIALSESLRKSAGTYISAGPGGSVCGCCHGSGRSAV